MCYVNYPRIALICPTYGQFHYARLTIESFLRYTPDPLVLVVDDASPDWEMPHWQEFLGSDCPQVLDHHFLQNGGLTRSWNWGIGRAIEEGSEYIIAGNSDILFCDKWYEGMLGALSSGYSLVGPLSNAPGPTSRGEAYIGKYIKNYYLSDDPRYLDTVSLFLRDRFRGTTVETSINGFFQMARAETWETGRFDREHFYKPRNDFHPDGSANPTPLMTFSEDELQIRWARLGRKFAVCPSSFIFHYRSVSRGVEHVHGSWYRVSHESARSITRASTADPGDRVADDFRDAAAGEE